MIDWDSYHPAGPRGPRWTRGGHGWQGSDPRRDLRAWLIHMAHGPVRAEPGEVRYLILDALKGKPCHGYQIIGVIEERSQGRYRPSPGTIYPYLQLLEEMGNVSSSRDANRTVYAITQTGLAELEAHRGDVEDAYERLNAGGHGFDGLDFAPLDVPAQRLKRVVRSAFRAGRVGQAELQAIGTVLEEAIDKIELVLARKEGRAGGSEGAK